jgi:RNA polymerase sigma-70 factor (ECF subfamily)
LSSQPAFEDLHREHGDRVYRYCLRLCGGNVSEAQDVAQETFVRAYRSLDNVRNGRAAAAWMLRIAHTEWIRYQARQRETVSLDEVGDLPDHRSDPGRTELNRLWLESTIARLPEHQRAALLLVKGEGLTHREAAEILGIPQGTLQFHVHEALRFLRKQASEERRLPGFFAFLLVLLLQRELGAAPAHPAAPVIAARVPRQLLGGASATCVAALVIVPAWNQSQARPWDTQTSVILQAFDRTPSAYATGSSSSRQLTSAPSETRPEPIEIWYERPGTYLRRKSDSWSDDAIRLTPRNSLVAHRSPNKQFEIDFDRSLGQGAVAPFSFFTRDGRFRQALRARKGVRVVVEALSSGAGQRRLTVEQETVEQEARWIRCHWVVTLDNASRPARVEYLCRSRYRLEPIQETQVVLDRIIYGLALPSELLAPPRPR